MENLQTAVDLYGTRITETKQLPPKLKGSGQWMD